MDRKSIERHVEDGGYGGFAADLAMAEARKLILRNEMGTMNERDGYLDGHETHNAMMALVEGIAGFCR